MLVTVRSGRVSWVHAQPAGFEQAWDGTAGDNGSINATSKGLGFTATDADKNVI
jgi:hypothetical protein